MLSVETVLYASLCTICGASDNIRILSKRNDGRGEGQISLCRCLRCGAVFLESGSAGYDLGHYTYYEERKSLSKLEIYNPITEAGLTVLLNWLAQRSPGKRVLDVGCGQGHFVDVALRAGFEVLGIEVSDSAVSVCQSFSLPVVRMDIFSPELQGASYDICTMFEVLEHVPDPAKVLARAAELLRPGGILYLTTPNFASLDRRLLGEGWRAINREHLTYFEPKTLRRMVSEFTRLEVEWLRTRNMSLHALKTFVARRTGETLDDPKGMVDREKTQELRKIVQRSKVLKKMRDIVNYGLNATGTGSSLVALLRKPRTGEESAQQPLALACDGASTRG